MLHLEWLINLRRFIKWFCCFINGSRQLDKRKKGKREIVYIIRLKKWLDWRETEVLDWWYNDTIDNGRHEGKVSEWDVLLWIVIGITSPEVKAKARHFRVKVFSFDLRHHHHHHHDLRSSIWKAQKGKRKEKVLLNKRWGMATGWWHVLMATAK